MDIKSNNLKTKDYKTIARLHRDHINNGFLGTLGIPFLMLLYEAIDKDEDSVLLLEKKDRVIVGFISGTLGLKSIYKRLLMQPYKLICSLKTNFLSIFKMYKILEILLKTKSDNKEKDLPKYELLSMVVDPAFQGKGYAESLFKSLCNHFNEKGIESFKIMVGRNLTKANAFYTKMGSIPVKETQIHKGSNSLIYIKKTD
tara:strand:- start:2389 stop:2988 length:600 start_codon:yes stop_codon:yes gene_type:complete